MLSLPLSIQQQAEREMSMVVQQFILLLTSLCWFATLYLYHPLSTAFIRHK